MEKEEKTKILVNDITNFLNNFNPDYDLFCNTMSSEHRTLQNTFTKLCLKWIEHTSKDEYRTDLRNQSSKNVSSELIELWTEKQISKGWTDETLKIMSKPSNHINLV